jgi:hypothetical protein
LKTDNCLRALSEIENIQIDLVDPRDLFGAIKSDRVASITTSGPLRRLSRLYDKEWASAEVLMSKLERHISEIVEEESQGSVAQKYSTPPGGHFCVLRMLKGINLQHLLVLEATGKTLNGLIVYRRAEILKLQYIDPSHKASPELIASLKKMETSITAQLGLGEKPPKAQRIPNAVFLEVEGEDWVKETVMVV